MNRRDVLKTGLTITGVSTLSGCYTRASFDYTPPDPVVGADVVFDAGNSIGDLYWFFDTDPGGFLSLERADRQGEVVTYSFDRAGAHDVTLVANSGQSSSEEARAVYVYQNGENDESNGSNQTSTSESGIEEEFEQFDILLKGDRTQIKTSESALIEFSIVNHIGNGPVNVQLILETPSGTTVSHTAFVDSGQGIFTTTKELSPGEADGMRIEIVPEHSGQFNITGRVICEVEDGTTITRTANIPIIVRDE